MAIVGPASVPAGQLENPEMKRPHRKNIRLPSAIYENPSLIFSITICTWHRTPIFSISAYADTLTNNLHQGLFADTINLYAYCLMPDHLHLLMSPKTGNLCDLIGRWKSYTANLLRKAGLNSKLWQRGFYDHALRKEEDIKVTSDYIVNNPVRAGIATRWRDYEHSWHRWMT